MTYAIGAQSFEQIIYRPRLVTPCVVRAIMGWTHDQLMDAMHRGRIVWAWDISRQTARTRKELRFWLPDVLGVSAPRDIDRVIDMVMGASMRRWYWGSDVSRLLACSIQHVTSLIGDGELVLHSSTPHGRRVDAASLRSFLRRRIV